MTMNIFQKILFSIKMGIQIFKRPDVFQKGVLGMITGIFDLVAQSVKEKRPMMSKIVINITDHEPHEIMSLWVGVGEAASPIKRCGELKTENDYLKAKLKLYEENDDPVI